MLGGWLIDQILCEKLDVFRLLRVKWSLREDSGFGYRHKQHVYRHWYVVCGKCTLEAWSLIGQCLVIE